MKKLYSIVATAIMGAFCMTASAQTEYKVLEDLTSKKLVNADFSADEPVSSLIRTYAKDLTDDGLGAGGTEMYGQQPVSGWTAARPTDNIKNDPSAVGGDACASGIFSYRAEEEEENPEAKLGGDYYAPFGYDCTYTSGGKCLGVAGVWGGTVQYTQDVTLPAGSYMIVIPVANTAGTGTITKSLNGFITADGVEYLAEKTTYDVGMQQNDVIAFKLKAETSGKISVGYQAGNVGSGATPHLFIDGVQLYSIDSAELDAAEIAAAKETLMVLIEEAEQLDVDTKASWAVYNNDGATLEQVLAAIDAQKAANEASMVDLSEFFIANPHFNIDEPIAEGDGICTYDYDMKVHGAAHYGMQPLTGWVASDPSDNVEMAGRTEANGNGRASGVFEIGKQAFLGGPDFLSPMTMSDGSTEGKVLGFISVWNCVSQYKQNVTIPAGKYTLTISYYNVGGKGTVAKNYMGFVADSGEEYLSDVTTFKEGSWEKFKIMFELDEPTSGYFTLGMQAANAGSGSMPHFFIDGITLNYVGDVNFDPSLLALQAAVSSATNLLDSNMSTDLLEQLRGLINDGSNLVSSQSDDKEANKAATDAINDLLPVVRANIAAYEKLQQFRDEDLEDALAKYESIEVIHENLLTLSDDVDEALNEFTWSTEEIEAAIASLNTIIKEGLQTTWDAAIASGETLDEPLDITLLIDGLAYTYSTSAVSGNNVPDKEWAFGSASNFKTQYGTAEVWNQSPFEVSRTLSDMPAGTYTIKTRAFYRTSDQQSSYDAYTGGDKEPKAFIFAGHSKAALTNVAEIASDDEATFETSSALSDGKYVPNNQKTAYNIFESDEFAEAVETSVTTVLAENGELKFGIKGDQMDANCWVVWYSFQIAYNAIDEEVLGDELQSLIEEANDLSENVYYNQEALSSLTSASAKGESALGGSKQDKIDATVALNSAISYANESVALYGKLSSLADTFTNMLGEAEINSTSTAIYDLLGAAADEDFESNEQMQSIMDAIPGAWASFVLGQDLAGATENEPVDVTAAIINPAFEWENANYWTITPEDAEEGDGKVGQNQGYQNNTTYTYTDEETGEEILIEKFIEAWRPNGTILNNGVVGQEIKAALPAGYYVLEADVFAVNQSTIPEEGLSGVYLMAKNNAQGTAKTDVCIDLKSGENAPRHHAVEFYSDGQGLTTVGLLVENTTASWVVADNFTLKYVGTTPPVAIEATEAAGAQATAIYTVGGIRLNALTKGINIVKMSNGTVVKIVK